MNILTSTLKITILLFVLNSTSSYAQSAPSNSTNWPIIKQHLFTGKTIITDGVLILSTPTRAENAAIVPIRIQANMAQKSALFIEKIYLIVDNNPVPLVGIFKATLDNGFADLATRIRINAYSHVRAIAQTSDGQLHMAVNFVKASGGCSAPAAGDNEQAIKRRGKMKLRHSAPENDNERHTYRDSNEFTQLQLMISHPNNSGLQIDQLSLLWIPADYVNQVSLTLNNREIFSFKGGISLSENPSVRFLIKKKLRGEFSASVTDSQGRHFQQQWSVGPKN